MPDSVMGSYQLPPINLLSMLLQGPKSYFSQRGSLEDQIYMANQTQQMRGAFADSLLASPAYKTALANPLDRGAQFGLWALAQHGPEAIANEGGQWLQQQLGAANQNAATMLEDRLSKERITFATDEQLRQYKTQKALESQALADQFKLVNAVDPATGQPMFNQQQQNDMTYDLLSHNFGLKPRPDGYSIGRDQNGNTFFHPTPGTATWGTAMDELTPIQKQNSAVAQLQDMVDGRTPWDRATAQALVQTVQDGIRKQGGFGSLDAGTADAMNKYLAQVGGALSQYNPTGEFALTAKESLRNLSIQGQSALQAWQRKWRIDAAQAGDPYGYKRKELPPPPKEPADKGVPAPRQSGSVGAGGSVGAPNLLGDPAGTAKKSGEQYQRDKEALKRKFPNARF